MNLNNKQVTLHIYNVRNQNTFSFDEEYNKKVSFIFILFLIAISYFSFNRSNKPDHVPM